MTHGVALSCIALDSCGRRRALFMGLGQRGDELGGFYTRANVGT